MAYRLDPAPPPEAERQAFSMLAPAGFRLKPSPAPHRLCSFVTSDDDLFEIFHMGAAVVEAAKWRLVVDGMVKRPFSLDLETLKSLPAQEVTSFHECYGSPLKPPTEPMRRVGNVVWTGVRLNLLLREAGIDSAARFIWSEGLDRGEFAGKRIDRYQKDLPRDKAMSDEVLVAYAMNGQHLRKERGGPVRLVVPGWFGTNMTKWLCHLSAQTHRAPGPFAAEWYNEDVIVNGERVRRAVSVVSPNAIIVDPAHDAVVAGPSVRVSGWAWSCDGIKEVHLSADDGASWQRAQVEPRSGFEWQAFTGKSDLRHAQTFVMARAVGVNGETQPLEGARNCVHGVSIIRQLG